MTHSITSWQCRVCGNYSGDYEERDRTWASHLAFHELSQEQYDRFVNGHGGGLSKMKVTLLSWSNNAELALVSFLSQTWGPTVSLSDYTPQEVSLMMQMALEGRTLPTALESVSFTFQIEGISRACSHQLVRVRIGSGFSQKGMSDVYYGDTDYVIPATVEAVGKTEKYIEFMEQCSAFYRELVADGVPFQDARFVIPQAATTTVVWTVNYLALREFCAKRLQNFMQWEINTLARMIREEVRAVYPLFADSLKPRCEMTGQCQAFGNTFAGCGKFPLPHNHGRHIFRAEQNTKCLRFGPAAVEQLRQHNQKIPMPGENHWLAVARERLASIESNNE